MIYLNSKNITYRPAASSDFEAIKDLLALSGLPVSDVVFGSQQFIVAEAGGRLVGCAALEVFGVSGLFRSFAVQKAFRNLKIGNELHRRILELARDLDLQEVFLLTTTASEYFRKAGWEQTDRKNVPPPLAASKEFAGLCPASAVCMHKKQL